MRTIENVSALQALVGQAVADSGWLTMTQDRISAFAEATGDSQWIHLDAARARAESPYGTTIAHGFLTLSLVTAMHFDAVKVGELRMAINYGLNRVRFMSPVTCGSRIRGRFTLASVEDVKDAKQAVWDVTIEREGSDKPVAVVEWVVRYYPVPVS